MIKLQALCIEGEGDQARLHVTIEDGNGLTSEHDYVGSITSGVTFRNSGFVHIEVTVCPVDPLKKDNSPTAKFLS